MFNTNATLISDINCRLV